MKKRWWMIFPFILLFILSACNMQNFADEVIEGQEQTVAAQVGATLTAMAPAHSPTPEATTEPTPATGTITGKLSYPSEFIPAQHVVAFQVGSDDWYDVTTVEGQGDYVITGLPVGSYVVVAYLADAATAEESLNASAGYTQAVPCGLSVDCNDHALIEVQVDAGSTVDGVNPQDWYAAPEEKTWPADPSLPEGQAGLTGIAGNIAYPSEIIPPQRVVAFDVNDLKTYYLAEVREGQTYTLETPPGTYFVVSYLISPSDLGATPGLAGGYSQAVLCGLTVACEDHSLVPVEVPEGQLVEGIDPVDWYRPPRQSDWPADPTVPETGAFSGSLGYPSEGIPPLRVVAFDVYSDWYYYVDTMQNQGQYQILDLPVGTYRVVAFVRDGSAMTGGYTYAVPCGLSVDCDNHRLIDVNVYPGQTAEGVAPVDFYADPDAWDWPDDPT